MREAGEIDMGARDLCGGGQIGGAESLTSADGLPSGCPAPKGCWIFNVMVALKRYPDTKRAFFKPTFRPTRYLIS